MCTVNGNSSIIQLESYFFCFSKVQVRQMYLEEKTKVNGTQAIHCKHPSQFPNWLPGVEFNQYNLYRVSPKKFVSKGCKLLLQSIRMWLINHLLSQTDPDAYLFVVNVVQLHIGLKLNKPNIIFHKTSHFLWHKGGDFYFRQAGAPPPQKSAENLPTVVVHAHSFPCAILALYFVSDRLTARFLAPLDLTMLSDLSNTLIITDWNDGHN